MPNENVSKKYPVRPAELREVLRAVSFLVAAREAMSSGEPSTHQGVATNTFYPNHPAHGVTDALNVLIDFMETFP